jgi:hypothetical protein
MNARILTTFADELRKIGEGFVPSDNTISAPLHFAPENERWRGMTAGEIEKEKRKAKYASIVKRGFLEELNHLVEKDASIKKVVKGTMLTAALAGGLGGGVKALQSRASSQAQKKQFSEKGKSEAWGRILGRKEQAKHQLGKVQAKRWDVVENLKGMGKGKFNINDPKDYARLQAQANRMDVLSKRHGKLKRELKEHETRRRATSSILPKGRVFISKERKLAPGRKRWGSGREGY